MGDSEITNGNAI